jgi:hypothetical protein
MRRVKEAVPLVECKRRALEYLQAHRRELTKASSVAGAIWPGAEFHAQGAGAAASRILKHLERDGLICCSRNDHDWGWKLAANSTGE